MAGEERDRLRARLRDLLIEARGRADLTQTGLAKRLGRPQSFVSNYESGQRRIEVAEIILIARALGEEPVEMLRRVGREGVSN
jgi:transcriptional regulator with XRE-family HTH domain